MEYSEPSRMRRFEFVRPAGRLDARRLLAALLLLISIAVVVVYLGRQALDASVSWLHNQPRYQLRFDEIELIPPPPDYFQGGAKRFLERVRSNASRPEILDFLPLLDLERDQLETVFKMSPWVENVESIEFPPRSIVVRLDYKYPAALVRIGAGEHVVLDRRGRLLPLEDIDVERLPRPTIQITGKGVVAPAPSRIGLDWKTETPEQPDLAWIDQRILQAARLAGFFIDPERKREAESTPALRMLVIAATDERGLFVQNAENMMLLWGEGPGDEKTGEPSAEEKWRILAASAKSSALDAKGKPGFWSFTLNELRFVPTRPRS